MSSNTHEDQEIVARKIQDHNLLAIPVVDSEKRLVGIVTVDDAIDILQEEETEDVFIKAGLNEIHSRETTRSYHLIKGTLRKVLGVRLPYLLITLLGGMLAGTIIGAFEETLESILALAFFIPVIMDMGGNVGTQSSTIFARGLVLGHIDLTHFKGQILREAKVGATMGLLLGIGAGLFGWLWQDFFELGLVVGISIFITITIATIIGFGVPYALTKLGYDQAAGADPIITTLKDVSGLVINFSMASLLLGHLI